MWSLFSPAIHAMDRLAGLETGAGDDSVRDGHRPGPSRRSPPARGLRQPNRFRVVLLEDEAKGVLVAET